jgi:hypothetical protein
MSQHQICTVVVTKGNKTDCMKYTKRQLKVSLTTISMTLGRDDIYVKMNNLSHIAIIGEDRWNYKTRGPE